MGGNVTRSLRIRLDALHRRLEASARHGRRVEVVYDPNFYGNAERLERLAPGWIRKRFQVDSEPQQT